MKYLILQITLIVLSMPALCQGMPESDITHIRIKEAEVVIEAEVKPIKKELKLNDLCYYYWYIHHQINKTQGGFTGRLLNGYYREFYLNKNFKQDGWFKNGLKTGTWKNWNEDGTLHQLENWKNGKKNGFYKNYDNEMIKETGNFTNDQLQGEIKYYKNNQLAEVKTYDRGIPVSTKASLKFLKKLNFLN